MDPFSSVKDSSVWTNPDHFSAMNNKDALIRIGVVQKVYVDENDGDIRYLVSVQDRIDKFPVNCRMMRRFGGVYNYEDVIYRGYKTTDKPDPVAAFEAKAGDMVLVAYFRGEAREGLILGGMTHPAREIQLDPDDGPQYKSEFNGMETFINLDGEMTITFKGQPTNLDGLSETPSEQIPEAEYDTDVGSTYMKFDKKGGWQISDNSSEDPQSILIDKDSKVIIITAGKVIVKLDKDKEVVTMTTKELEIDADDKITEKTKEYSLEASTSVKIKSDKIAIGSDSIELLDQLGQLIDAIGNLAPVSPVGPCAPLTGAPTWTQVTQIKTKIDQIKGSL